MNMSGYTKLFNSILASTIWREDDKTRLVWITMLAMAGKDGIVEGSIPGLADFARVSIADCETALKKLMAPDPYSRCQDFEGRRIETVDGGWIILNHRKYRDKMSADERREYLRIKQQEHRERCQRGVNSGFDKSTMSTHPEAEAEAEAEANRGSTPPTPPPRSKKSLDVQIPESLKTDEFETAWTEWVEFRRQLKKPLTALGAAKQLKKLAELPVSEAVAIIEQSIANGWQGLFPLKPHRLGVKPETIADDDGWGDSTPEEIANCNQPPR